MMSKKREKIFKYRDNKLKVIIQNSYKPIFFRREDAVSNCIEENLKHKNQNSLLSIRKERRMKFQLITDLALAGAITAAAVALVVVLQLNQIYSVPKVSQIGLVDSEELILAGEQPFALIQLASIGEWGVE
jgi:hypothetical protein